MVRDDLTIDWNVSPRIITIAKDGAASESISLQDLVDTLRSIEYQVDTQSYIYLIDSFGKQNLGGGVLVGITLVLNNAKLAFEARGGPTFVQCNISGGNLVAVDENGDDMDAVETTAYTQVIKTSSSSATLQELQDIQYSSFNGGVSIDITSLYSGTSYPIGTPRQPVNNLTDAMLIATERGFPTLYIIGDITVDVSGDYTGMQFIGESPSKSTLTIASAAIVLGCEFKDCTLTGVLDGNARVECCIIDDLNYVYGCIYNSVLKGKITLGGNYPAMVIDCRCFPQTEVAVIDMGGSGQDLGVRNFNGKIKIENLTGSNIASLDMNSGEVIADSTVSAGTIIIRGIGTVTDNSTGTAVVDTTRLIQSDIITAIRDSVDIEQAKVNDGAPTTYKFITTLTETMNAFWSRAALLFTSGQNKGQIRGIKSYTGFTKEVQLQTPLSYTPVNGDDFSIIPARKFLTPDVVELAEAVWSTTEAEIVRKMLENKVTKSNDIISIYEDDEITLWRTYDLADGGRVKQ